MGDAVQSEKRANSFEQFLRKQKGGPDEAQIKAFLAAVGADGELTGLIRAAGQLPEGSGDLLTMTGVRKIKPLGEWWYSGGRNGHGKWEDCVAAWLCWNKVDPVWLAARSDYAAFLRRESRGIKDSYLNNHLSSVEERGTLTWLVRDAGLLPKDVPSLLLLTDEKAVRAIAAWAAGGPGALNGSWPTYLRDWLSWKACPTAAAERPAPQSTEVLRRPPHGVRLRTLAQAFRKSQRLSAEESNSLLLDVLTDGEGGSYGGSAYSEGHPAFRAVRAKVLGRLADQPDGVLADLLETAWGENLADLCVTTVADILGDPSQQLLTFLSEHSVAYEDSLLPQLADLYDAGIRETDDRTRAECWLKLVRAVLRDSAEGAPVERPDVPRGGALQDSRFHAGMLPAAMFHTLHAAARAAHGEDAVRLSRAVQNFMRVHWEGLKDTLPVPCPPWEPIPAEQLRGGSDGSVLAIRLLVERAERLLMYPTEGDMDLEAPSEEMSGAAEEIGQTRAGVRLMEARRCVEEALKRVDVQLEQKQVAAELCSGHGAIYGLQFRAYLCGAGVTRALSLLEREEDRLDDAIGLYFIRCRADLTGAGNALNQMTLTEPKACADSRTRWKDLCENCYKLFFGQTSALVGRLCVPEGAGAQERYQAELEQWQQRFRLGGGVGTGRAPKIVRPMDLAPQPGDELLFQTIFSGVFDSAAGKDWVRQQPEAEDAIFRLVSSEYTCLFQMNQVVDNLSFLRMLDVSAVRWLCRKGILSLSCYTFRGKPISSPYAYLMHCLDDPDYRFSSSSAYALYPECRAIMKDYLLTGSGGDRFSSECRAEMLELADRYRIVFESFQPSDLRRYHQDDAIRYPSREMEKTVLPLYQVVQWRAGRLMEEANAGCGQDPEIAGSFVAFAEQWGDLENRSLYDAAIKAERQGASPEKIIQLDKFQRMVYQCYFLSNGWRCCPEVQLTENDPDLILSEERNRAQESEGAPEYIISQRRDPDTRYQIDWSNFCEQAAIVRQCRRMDRASRAEQRLAVLESYLGCGYDCAGEKLYLSEYSTKTSDGRITHYAPAAPREDGGEVLEFHSAKK